MESRKKAVKDSKSSLATRIDLLEKHCKHIEEVSVRKINSLENRIDSLENIIKNLKKQIESDDKEKIACRLCQFKFKRGTELKKHIAAVHAKKFQCRYCDEEFDLRWKLEFHMKSHEHFENLKCSDCDKTFLLRWRLNRHRALHGNLKIKCCHYFNNGKPCPYEEIGCKFRHVDAPDCKYQEQCFQNLCPYKHEKTDSSNDDTEKQTEHNTCDNEQTLDVDDLCEKMLKAAEDSEYEEEDVLSDSFLDNILRNRETSDEVFEEKSDDTIETTKYYPDCKHCGEKEYDCVECIIKDIHRTEARDKTGFQ